MALVLVETLSEQPITPELLAAADEKVLPCLKARNANWRYSLLSSDRHRMICTFDAPDAESVREGYRRGGEPRKCIWSGVLVQPEGIQPEGIQPEGFLPQCQPDRLTVIEETYPPFSEAEWNEINHKISTCYAEHGIEWIRSYVSLDRTRVIGELNAPDIESIQAARRQLDIAFERIWSAQILTP